jgi:hypothetical protein
MVVEATLGAGLRVAAIPHAHVHGKDGRRSAPGEWMVGEQPPQSLGVDSSTAQRVVEAAPATAVRWLQAQADWRMDRFCGEEGVGDLEEGVSAAMEAVVE